MGRKRIFIGIPCYSNPAPETFEDYMRFAYYLGRRYQEYDFFLGIKTKAEQFRARNAIVEAAYQIGADYLLMMDDDHVIDIDNSNGPSERYEFLRKLLDHHKSIPDAGIIGVLYFHRGGECRPVLMEEKDGQYLYLRDDQIMHDLQEVSVQGGGCMLIKMKVFDMIGSSPFHPEHEYGTDFQVCRAARKAGFRVFSDTSIEIGHLKNERSIVSNKNRYLHHAQSTENSDRIASNFRISTILKDFKEDVMEYLDINDTKRLVELANTYHAHQMKFHQYASAGNIEDFYRDSGESYLARACFIHSTENIKQFDDFLLTVIKADYPGVGIDFGCGSAPITFDLCKRGQQIYFYDIEGSAPFEFLKWRAKKYNLFGYKAMFEKDWPSNIDYVLCLDSIEHLVDWKGILEKIAGSLKFGGALITNFILLEDKDNQEHVFMDKPAFMSYATKLGLWPLNPAIFQKRNDIQIREEVKQHAMQGQ